MLPDLVSLALFVLASLKRAALPKLPKPATSRCQRPARLWVCSSTTTVKLLDRTARGAELTAAGRAVVQPALTDLRCRRIGDFIQAAGLCGKVHRSRSLRAPKRPEGRL